MIYHFSKLITHFSLAIAPIQIWYRFIPHFISFALFPSTLIWSKCFDGNIKFWIRGLLFEKGCQWLENDCDDIWTFQNFSLSMASEATTLQTLIHNLPLIYTKVPGFYKHDLWVQFMTGEFNSLYFLPLQCSQNTEILISILILDPEVCYQMRGHQSLEHGCDDEFDVLNKTAQRWQRHVASLSDHDCLSQVCYMFQLFLLLWHLQVLE